MNQILNTKLNKNPNKFKKRNWFEFQLFFSIIIIIITLILHINSFYYLEKEANISNNLIDNYNIYKIYSNNKNQLANENKLFGMIEIQKINLYYPIFSYINEDLLKIAPCKFYGKSPNNNSNICIAGHNYNNSLFFSKINTLSKNDEIIIFDINGNKYIYYVYDIYEVKPSDLSPIFNYEKNEKQLTLITCNNLNSNRIILKAKQKKLS